MSRVLLTATAITVIIAAIVAYSALFTVRETEQAIVLQFGDPRRVVKDPGLHVMVPFIQDVVRYDSRVLGYAPPAEEIITSDQKRLVVDTYARYEIVDPLKFYQAARSEEAFRAALGNYMMSSLRRVIGSRTFASVLSEERAQIMRDIQKMLNADTESFGVDVVDFRIRRADLPEANAQAIYARMQSEREREAREFRARGAEQAQRIRARADRERAVLLADARREAQILRGQGDAEATRIYAESFGQDPGFFAFYRSMQAYREAMGEDENTTIVLSSDSEFFRFFGDMGGGRLAPVVEEATPSGAAPTTAEPETSQPPETGSESSAE